MRGELNQKQSMLCYISPQGFVPQNHPLRPVKEMVDAALMRLSPKFDEMYSHTGRITLGTEHTADALFVPVQFIRHCQHGLGSIESARSQRAI